MIRSPGKNLGNRENTFKTTYRTGLYVIHFKRAKYADPNDALCRVVTAPALGDVFDSASGRSRYDISFVAKEVADKVENAIPRKRQARMFGNEGLPEATGNPEKARPRNENPDRPGPCPEPVRIPGVGSPQPSLPDQACADWRMPSANTSRISSRRGHSGRACARSYPSANSSGVLSG